MPADGRPPPTTGREVLRLRVELAPSGTLFFVTADEPKGLLVAERSLAAALAAVPAALAEFREAGAPMPRLEGLDLT
jgi:hypothetical protein